MALGKQRQSWSELVQENSISLPAKHCLTSLENEKMATKIALALWQHAN